MPTTLRDFVSNKKIKAPNQNNWWTEVNFTNEGYNGSTGPELGECFYNFTHHIINNGEKTLEYAMSWEKIHEPPTGYTGYTSFYPIIGLALDLDHTYPGAIREIGEGYWWNVNNNINGKLGLYKNNVMAKSELFATNENHFAAYYDNDWALVMEGFDVVCQAAYAPQYDQYWYKPGAYTNMLSSSLWFTPFIINGDPRHSYSHWFDVFAVNSNVYTENAPCLNEVDTNIPVIVWDYDYYTAHSGDVTSAMHSYLTDGDLSRFSQLQTDGYCVIANRFVQPTDEGVKNFQCYCDVYEGDWDYSGVSDEEFVEYRYINIFVKPSLTSPRARVTLIKDPTSSELRARLKVYGDIVKVRYSTDGGNSWSESSELPWEYLYYKRTNEIGTLKYDQNHGGNILLYASEALSDDGADYLADDYAEKSQYYPATNETGTAETSTTMGTTTLNSFFQRMYIVDKADMAVISSALYDTSQGGIWEDIQKGIEMFGENPIDCVAGLCYFPIDLTTVFTGAGSASSVWFGGYQLTGVSVYELMNYNGYVDIGTMENFL